MWYVSHTHTHTAITIDRLALLSTGPQVMEWVSYAIRKVEVEINCLVRLLLFANIKHSLAVSTPATPDSGC